MGRNVSTVQGDVAKLDDLDRLYGQIRAEKGGLDIVVASAGFVEPTTMAAATPEHFDKTFGTNARGVFFTVQKAAPLMRDGGAMVLVSSGVHLKGIPMYVTYGATKAALRSFARSMAAKLKDRRIGVNTLSPGAIDTPIIDNQFRTKKEANGLREMFKQLNPLGRIGRAEEMAKAILFLAPDDSSYTNASDLAADGGMIQI